MEARLVSAGSSRLTVFRWIASAILSVAALAVALPAAPASASDGTLLETWGSLGTGAGQFESPSAVETDAADNVYVVDRENNRIQKFDSNGNFLSMWGWGVRDGSAEFQICTSGCQAGIAGTGAGQLDNPHAIAIDANGNVYVTDDDGGFGTVRIQKFDANGTYSPAWGTGLSGVVCCGLGVDPTGNLWTTSGSGGFLVQEIAPDGTYLDQCYFNHREEDPNKCYFRTEARIHDIDFYDPGIIYTDSVTGLENPLYIDYKVGDGVNTSVGTYWLQQESYTLSPSPAGIQHSGNETGGALGDIPHSEIPQGITTDPIGHVYLLGESNVLKFDSETSLDPQHPGAVLSTLTLAEKWKLPIPQLPIRAGIMGIAADSESNIYVAAAGGQILKYGTNRPPTANAGPDQTVPSKATVTLDGSGSSDPDGDTLSYEWAQLGTPSVTLNGAATAKATFTAPLVSAQTTLTFTVAVFDGHGHEAIDAVQVKVLPPTINSLVASLNALLSDASTIKRPLMEKLNEASRQCDKHNRAGALNALADFIALVKAQRGKKIAAAADDALVAEAEAVRKSLVC